MSDMPQGAMDPNAPGAMGRVRHLHFVGIGGAGMGGIAEVLCNLGYTVTGSDLRENAITRRLAGLGVTVYIGHDAGHVAAADAVVISSAVGEDNPEVQAARRRRLPVVPRAEMLAELMRFRFGIAVAGTHGKTTTTSLVASILAEGGQDPTFVIGGRLNSAASHARLGAGRYLVAEADESDASFLYLKPMIAAVTNVDADHLGTYEGDFQRLRGTFLEFLHHLPFYGLAVMCIDDPQVRELVDRVTCPVRTYGFAEDADVRATDIRQDGIATRFTVTVEDGEPFEVTLNLPGRHNAQNALAAIAIAAELEIPQEAMQRALAHFQGIGRRFQVYGELALPGGRALLVDDYAHHPREIAAVIHAVREGWPGRRLVVAFQPHRYSRTQELFDEFARALSEADALLISEVYAAGEAPLPGVDGASLCRAVRARGQVNPVFAADVEELGALVPDVVRDGDLLITLGAGSIGGVAPALVARFGDGEERA
ncbi:UDP-N-acetylmuramate--L-alanine ligase [wastewater metagenome]|uniref:UDP-N-acetylmuramate--L-alanine ligase n=2 Tax=unclassified sequences TaxID=12908 RepID=A0A5B8R8F1_9ZZZZ|nr:MULTISPECIES: UDP-N-acetylmuramate--L-alanine ligase [Arhodomonas]MCS4504703.1 UDP-N-acetylmuramate--L-alanine ligase [Arhodomonas aquaeolei]QEA04980.1 UDP-N-acetylmuramate--L-alanine ligase [uncultured organism]